VLNTLLKYTTTNLNDLSELKDYLFIKNIDKIKIIDGVHNIINNIKMSGNKICIVTNCNKQVATEILKIIKLDKIIDFLISANDILIGKPNPDPYLKAIDKYKISNNKCIIFEDSKTGIISAVGAKPKLLVGLETNYTKNELYNSGVNLSIKNFLDFQIDNILCESDNFNENQLKDIIRNNSTICNIKEILLDNNKLKGGFIADVTAFDIITRDNVRYSLILKYDNGYDNNLSFVAKQLKLYEREYYFYTDIYKYTNINKPIFYNLTFKNQIPNGIVLENFFTKKFNNNIYLNTHSIDVTLKIVDRFAYMHSQFWNKNLKILFPNLKNYNDIEFNPFFKKFIDDRYEIFKQKWCTVFNKEQMYLLNNMYENFENCRKKFVECDNLTFIHGDIKSPNIFYDCVNSYEPYFIDWQHCAIGKGVQDLVFFIIESFDDENIESIYTITKTYYYKKLIEYGITNYSLTDYNKDFYDAICFIPFFTSVWFGSTPQDELIDKNFPYFLIKKMLHLESLIH